MEKTKFKDLYFLIYIYMYIFSYRILENYMLRILFLEFST